MSDALQIKVTKKADDAEGIVRVSVGGLAAPMENGVYCVYRGPLDTAIAATEAALGALKGIREFLGPDKEPDIQPDDGKKYA